MGSASRRLCAGRARGPMHIAALAIVILGVAFGLSAGARAAAPVTGGGAAPSAHVPPTDVVTIGSAATGRPVPPGFVGVSMEYNTVTAYESTAPNGTDAALAQLIRNLAPDQTPIIRIGGDSTDWTWWPIPRLDPPPGVNNPLTPNWVASARELAQSAGARLILGINLEADNPSLAETEASELVTGIGSSQIEALEIGNEPELYPFLPWYHTKTGRHVYGRPPTYDLADYGEEFEKFRTVLPRVALAGPSMSNSWLPQLGPFLNRTSGLGLVTFHAYGVDRNDDAFRGRNCSTTGSDPANPSVPALLAPIASQGTMVGVPPAIALVHSHHLDFRVDEMNAITCAGTPGVSDTFASALWAISTLFTMADDGVDGVNVHTWRGSAGRLFDFNLAGGQWVGTVAPDYYGLLFFSQAAPAGSRVLPAAETNGGQVQSWATVDPDYTIRVMLVNDSLSEARSVLIRPPDTATGAQLEFLQAPSAYATSGVTLGGQTFGAQTTTGLLSGTAATSQLTRADGGFTVALPAASAALITIPDAGPAHRGRV